MSVVASVAAPRAAWSDRQLLTDITVDHGPVDVLGRFFILADAAARERGVTLSFGTFDELLEINAANRDSWKPVTSMYDVRYCPQGLAPENAFCIFGRNAEGRVVATQAARIYRLDQASFHEEATSLRMFYDDPVREKAPDESCEVTAPIAKSLRGAILVGGAAWYRPDYRGRQLSAILPRISRAFAYTKWRTDWTTTLMMEGPMKGNVWQSSGYTEFQWDLRLFNAPNGNPRCAICWMPPEQLISDLRQQLEDLGAQVDPGVAQRRA
jgi:hypothetical protein